MRLDRIVRRQNLREQFATLKAQVKDSRPFLEAQDKLRQAFAAGYNYRVEEEAKAREKAEKEVLQSQDLAPLTVGTEAGLTAAVDQSSDVAPHVAELASDTQEQGHHQGQPNLEEKPPVG